MIHTEYTLHVCLRHLSRVGIKLEKEISMENDFKKKVWFSRWSRLDIFVESSLRMEMSYTFNISLILPKANTSRNPTQIVGIIYDVTFRLGTRGHRDCLHQMLMSDNCYHKWYYCSRWCQGIPLHHICRSYLWTEYNGKQFRGKLKTHKPLKWAITQLMVIN